MQNQRSLCKISEFFEKFPFVFSNCAFIFDHGQQIVASRTKKFRNFSFFLSYIEKFCEPSLREDVKFGFSLQFG